ncbi:MAG: outer membrane lipoprotein LolB [Pseudomonadota bacterium]
MPKHFLLILALLTGCATTGAPPSNAPVAPYRDAIELSGRIAVNYRKDGNPESVNGQFNWAQHGNRIELTLASPTGQTMATIKVTPDAATLTQADQVPRTAADIDTLTAQTLGWSLPVSGLRDWLQGYAKGADGKRFVATPASNTVSTPDGWRLRFVSWHEGAHPAPKRIDAERSATPGSDELALRIVIDAPVQ